MMKAVTDLCRSHRRTSYYDDGEGHIGVANHRNTILWYRWTPGGYSLTGETDTPEGAQHRKLETEGGAA